MKQKAQPSLRVEEEGAITTLTLSRPDKNNALSPELVERLLKTLKQLSQDESVRVLILSGSGERAFCSGYDIGSLTANKDEDVDTYLNRLGWVELLFQRVSQFPWPVIVKLNGAAFGAGYELAACGDIRIGAPNIRIAMPPAKLGLVYPWRGLKRFIQLLGLSMTKEMFFTGAVYSGSRLKEAGLVDHLISLEDLEAFTWQMAEAIATNAPMALQGTKKIINLIANKGDLSDADLVSADTLTRKAFMSDDAKEGRRAFFEKRQPRFKGL